MEVLTIFVAVLVLKEESLLTVSCYSLDGLRDFTGNELTVQDLTYSNEQLSQPQGNTSSNNELSHLKEIEHLNQHRNANSQSIQGWAEKEKEHNIIFKNDLFTLLENIGFNHKKRKKLKTNSEIKNKIKLAEIVVAANKTKNYNSTNENDIEDERDKRAITEEEPEREEPRGLISLFKKSIGRKGLTTVAIPPPISPRYNNFNSPGRFSMDSFRRDSFRNEPLFTSMRKSSNLPPVYYPGTGASRYPPASSYFGNYPSSSSSSYYQKNSPYSNYNYHRNSVKKKTASGYEGGTPQPIHVHLDIYPSFVKNNKNSGTQSKNAFSPSPERRFQTDVRQTSFANSPSLTNSHSSFGLSPSSFMNSPSTKIDSFSFSDENIDSPVSTNNNNNKHEIVLHLNFYPRQDGATGSFSLGGNRRSSDSPVASVRHPTYTNLNNNKGSRISYVVPISTEDFNPEIYGNNERVFGSDRTSGFLGNDRATSFSGHDRSGGGGMYLNFQNEDDESDYQSGDEWRFLPDPERFTQNSSSTAQEPDTVTQPEYSTQTTPLPPLPTPIE